MYDTSPESYVHGAVYRLLLMSTALSYCEYKVKTEVAFFTQVSMFVTNAACFLAKKIRRYKKISAIMTGTSPLVPIYP